MKRTIITKTIILTAMLATMTCTLTGCGEKNELDNRPVSDVSASLITSRNDSNVPAPSAPIDSTVTDSEQEPVRGENEISVPVDDNSDADTNSNSSTETESKPEIPASTSDNVQSFVQSKPTAPATSNSAPVQSTSSTTTASASSSTSTVIPPNPETVSIPKHEHDYKCVEETVVNGSNAYTYECKICGNKYSVIAPPKIEGIPETADTTVPAAETPDTKPTANPAPVNSTPARAPSKPATAPTAPISVPVTPQTPETKPSDKGATWSWTGTPTDWSQTGTPADQTPSVPETPAKPAEPAHAHSYTSAITRNATCQSEGVRTFTCSCGDTYTEPIAKLSHSYTSTVTLAPTCKSKGIETYKCSCGDSYAKDIPALGHNYQQQTVNDTTQVAKKETWYHVVRYNAYVTQYPELRNINELSGQLSGCTDENRLYILTSEYWTPNPSLTVNQDRVEWIIPTLTGKEETQSLYDTIITRMGLDPNIRKVELAKYYSNWTQTFALIETEEREVPGEYDTVPGTKTITVCTRCGHEQ